MQRSPWAGALATRQPWSIPRGVNQWVLPVMELCFWVLECDGSSEEVELIPEWTDVGLKGAERGRQVWGWTGAWREMSRCWEPPLLCP